MAASDSSTVSVTFPSQSIADGYQTSYSYDTLNNLTAVNQGSQTRSFSYSSLSRLLTAANPESGTISYVYDNNGNLTNKTDARSVLTTYDYDNLNRVLTRSYSSEPSGQTATPNVTYSYDNLTNAKGKLIKVDNGFSKTEYTQFDLLGRVTKSKQTTDNTAYNEMLYSYNLSGALIEETYPSGRVVKNTFDNDGDLAQVQSKKANDTFRNYANSFNYTAAGAVSSMRLGNGLWENTSFNSRLQPTQIGLGSGSTSQNLLKLNYDYGSTQNNGNVQSQTIIVPTVGSNSGFTATQTYTYDSLNRLKDAKEMIGTTETWKQTFTFDRYGNRNFDETNTTTLPKNCGTSPNFTVCAADRKVLNPSVNTSNNRLSTSDDYTFDSSGNTTKDAQNRKFTYDAENKQIKVETVDANGNVTGTLGEYFYDGDGKRVKKVSATETTIFVYDASGKMVAEYSTQLATTPQVSYLTSDHLGSPRINTDANGAVKARHDYQPFGEEIATSQRIAGLGYNSDEIRKKFTSYERDTETDLDYAQARYYAKNLGRFLSTDSINTVTVQKLADSQQLNLYLYARNNPLKFVDPSGMVIKTRNMTEGEQKQWDEVATLANLKDENGNYIHKELHRLYDRLDKSDKIFWIEGDVLGTPLDKDEGGLFNVTTFSNDGKDFTEAVITINFGVINEMRTTSKGQDFTKYEGLFGDNDSSIRRLAETFGHEAGHAEFALNNPADAVLGEVLYKESLPGGKIAEGVKKYNSEMLNIKKQRDRDKFQLPPDIKEKIDTRSRILVATEKYAQETEKIVNLELQNSKKK